MVYLVLSTNSWLVLVINDFLSRNFLVLSATTTNRNVPKSASFGPVPSTCLAEVPGLSEAVVVVVAELGVC